MSYVIIGKVTDIDKLEHVFPSFGATHINVQKGDWVFETNYEVGVLTKTDNLKNIQ